MTSRWSGLGRRKPLQFYRRLGGFHESQEGNALWAENCGRMLRSPEAAKALAKASVSWVTTHFFKGFGLATEVGEISQTTELIRVYHQQGLRVFAYIRIRHRDAGDDRGGRSTGTRVGSEGLERTA